MRAVLEELDLIADQFDAAAVQLVQRCLAAALKAGSSTIPDAVPDIGADTHARVAGSSASPYSTGGGGVTFERRVAVTYLARLLTGAPGNRAQ